MSLRVPHSLWLLCAMLGCVLTAARNSNGQIRAAASQETRPEPRASDATQNPTAVALNLCVEGTTTYPCPTPITSDGTYFPNIVLTYGQILDGVVTYSSSGGGPVTSGTITIFDYANTVCVLRIGIDQMCPANSTIFDFGPHILTATLTFPAGSTFADSMAAPVNISVAKDTSSLMLTSSANPATLGSAVTITALATGGYGAVPTGQIVLTQDGVTLPAITIDATGAARYTTSTLSLGTHTFGASYAGALDFLPAPADVMQLQQLIQPPSTVTTLASSANPSIQGQNVTFTASVATAAGFTGSPTGAVTFKDGTTAFGTVLVTPKNGQNLAQTNISTLSVGTHSITATYSGDASTSTSTSAVLVQQVEYPIAMPPSGYTITVKPSPVSIGVGQSIGLTATVTPVGGFSAPVLLSCSNLPSESACTFDEVTVPAGGGAVNFTLSTMAPHDCGSSVPYFNASMGPHLPGSTAKSLGIATPLLAGIVLIAIPGKRRRLGHGILALIAVCGLFGLNGCSSHCTDFGTYPGNYTFKVNGTTSTFMPVATTGTPATSDPSAINVTTSVALSVKL